jgi:peptide/nickel transport system permease protein
LQPSLKLSSVADLFGTQSQSSRRPTSSWLNPARGALLFAAKRLLGLAAVLLVISFGTFSLLTIAPGDPAQLLLGTRQQSPAVIHAVRHEYHLDRPFLVQYGIWLQHAVHFDFGRSIRTQDPVWSDISSRLGLSLFLGIYATLITVLVGVPLGVVAAVRQRKLVDRGVVALSVVGVSTPAFASGVAFLYLFAVRFGWFPVFGAGNGVVGRLYHLALPAVALSLTVMALVLKLTRAAVIGALEQDYIVFARARGLSERAVLSAYALRNAAIPIVTAAGAVLGALIAGAVLVEVAFTLPGTGSLLVESVEAKDVPMVQGLTATIAVVIVAVNLLTDLAYLALDPRMRFGVGAA